jgi:hypothetical protein
MGAGGTGNVTPKSGMSVEGRAVQQVEGMFKQRSSGLTFVG